VLVCPVLFDVTVTARPTATTGRERLGSSLLSVLSHSLPSHVRALASASISHSYGYAFRVVALLWRDERTFVALYRYAFDAANRRRNSSDTWGFAAIRVFA